MRLTAEVRVRLLLTWVGVSILINVSNSLADDSEVTTGAHTFQKFFGLSRRNYEKDPVILHKDVDDIPVIHSDRRL